MKSICSHSVGDTRFRMVQRASHMLDSPNYYLIANGPDSIPVFGFLGQNLERSVIRFERTRDFILANIAVDGYSE